MKFWNNEHPLCEEHDRLAEALIPMSGSCETLQGEFLRAVSRLYYDHYNNGSGNNTTGAWNLLDRTGARYIQEHLSEDQLQEFLNALYEIRPYANCNAPSVTFEETTLNDAFDEIVKTVTLFALKLEKENNFIPNSVNMFDFEDPTEYEEEDCWL